MKLDNLKTVAELESFLAGNQPVAFSVVANKDERYQFVEGILKRVAYSRLKRRDKGVVIQFLMKVTSDTPGIFFTYHINKPFFAT